jgi:cold shock CspA family protein
MMNGIVKSWNRDYGFITPLIGRPGQVDDIFAHKLALADGMQGLLVGAEVTFDLVRSDRGVQASGVRMLRERKINASVLIRDESDALKPARQRLTRVSGVAERKSS